MSTSPTTADPARAGGADPLAAVIPMRGRERQTHPAGRTRDAGQARDTSRAAPTGRAGQRPRPQRPDPARLAALLVRLTGEVAAGRRPLRQLEPLLAPTLARRLAAGLRPGIARPQREPVVVRTLAGDPTPSGAVEATVLVERDGRVTAVAVRLERHHGAWRATELTAPEAGYAPLPTRSSPHRWQGLDAFDEAEAEAVAEEATVTRRRGTA